MYGAYFPVRIPDPATRVRGQPGNSGFEAG